MGQSALAPYITGRLKLGPGNEDAIDVALERSEQRNVALELLMVALGANVQAANATDIELYEVGGGVESCPSAVPSCLASRPFSISYQDATGQWWEVDVAGATWTP